MADTDQMCLKWKHFGENLTNSLLRDQDFKDVTLVCDNGKQVQVHKIILAAAIPLLGNMIRMNRHSHTVIYLRGVKILDLDSIVAYIYAGKVNLADDNIDNFLELAKELQVKGLYSATDHGDAIEVTSSTKDVENESGPLGVLGDQEENADQENNADHLNTDSVISRTSLTGGCKQNYTGVTATDHKNKIESKIVENDRNWNCTDCGRRFRRIGHARDHVESMHVGGISYKCKHCPTTCESRDAISSHMRRLHGQHIKRTRR